MGRVVVVGSTNTDMTVKVPHLPRPGETVLGGDFYRAGGGKGANQAVAASRAGASVTLVGRTGEDVFGEEAREQLAEDDVNLDYLYSSPDTPSGVAIIVVDDDGENSIAVAPGANGEVTPADVEAAEPALRDADVLLAQLEVPMDAVDLALSLARAHDVVTILDPAPPQDLPASLLKNVSILTPNVGEAASLTGITPNSTDERRRVVEILREDGVDTVVLTLGSDGVYVASGSEQFHVEGRSVDARDATAAGDVFSGALGAALSEGHPLERAVEFANTAAALSVTKTGARPSVPFADEIEEAEADS